MAAPWHHTLRAAALAAGALGVTAADLAQLIARRSLAPPAARAVLAAHFRRRWAQHMLRVLKVRVEVYGKPAPVPAIYMANHRSYLDPPIIMAHVACTMLSKAEVARYPVIGPGARAVGIVFVQRESVRSRGASLGSIADAIASGQSVALFPEGSTFAGPEPAPFKPGVFALAAERGIPIVPLALEYGTPQDAWLTDALWPHFVHTLGTGRARRVALQIGEPMVNGDASYLMEQTRGFMAEHVPHLRAQLSWY